MPIPEGDGWRLLDETPTGFDAIMPSLWVRPVEGGAEAWLETGSASANVMGGMHGGFLAAVAEQLMFLPLHLHDRVGRGGVVTIDYTIKYVAAPVVGKPLVARYDLLRETGRLGFVAGQLRQDGNVMVAVTGTLRKLQSKGQS